MESMSAAEDKRSTFKYFPELASELRLKIWRQICFQPRNIDIGSRCHEYRCTDDGEIYERFLYVSNHYTVPSVLQISREARAEALRHYRFLIGNYQSPTITIETPLRFYFNPGSDRLCLHELVLHDLEGWADNLTELCIRNKIQSFALNIKSSYTSETLLGHNLMKEMLPWKAPFLREVIIYESLAFNGTPSDQMSFVEHKNHPGFKPSDENLKLFVADRSKVYDHSLLNNWISLGEAFDRYEETLISNGGKEPEHLHGDLWKRPTVNIMQLSINGVIEDYY